MFVGRMEAGTDEEVHNDFKATSENAERVSLSSAAIDAEYAP
jgi:hypothetical protein